MICPQKSIQKIGPLCLNSAAKADFALRRTLIFEIKFGGFCLHLSQGVDTSLVNRPSGDLNVQVKELENCLGDAESDPSLEA